MGNVIKCTGEYNLTAYVRILLECGIDSINDRNYNKLPFINRIWVLGTYTILNRNEWKLTEMNGNNSNEYPNLATSIDLIFQ